MTPQPHHASIQRRYINSEIAEISDENSDKNSDKNSDTASKKHKNQPRASLYAPQSRRRACGSAL